MNYHLVTTKKTKPSPVEEQPVKGACVGTLGAVYVCVPTSSSHDFTRSLSPPEDYLTHFDCKDNVPLKIEVH